MRTQFHIRDRSGGVAGALRDVRKCVSGVSEAVLDRNNRPSTCGFTLRNIRQGCTAGGFAFRHLSSALPLWPRRFGDIPKRRAQAGPSFWYIPIHNSSASFSLPHAKKPEPSRPQALRGTSFRRVAQASSLQIDQGASWKLALPNEKAPRGISFRKPFIQPEK